MTRRRRFVLYSIAALTTLVLATIATGVLVLRSEWFHDQVRQRMVEEIEKASGGKTEIGTFNFDWKTMTGEVTGFVLHGKERPGEPVFLRVKRIVVGLKVISALKKEVDLASGIVDQPEFHLVVYPDGTTNLPSPAVHREGTNFIDSILKLKMRRYEIRNGIVEFKEERVPLDIRGDNLVAVLDYDAAKAQYQGHLSSRQLHVETTKILPLIGNFDTDLSFDKNGMRFPTMVFAWPKSRVELAGTLDDWKAMHGSFDVRAKASLAELGDILRIPIEHRGDADFAGKVTLAFTPKFDYDIKGRVNGRNLALRLNGVEVAPVALDADAVVTPAGVDLPRVNVSALGGRFSGRAALPEFNRFRVSGDASNLLISELARFGTAKTLPWSGSVSGPVELSGLFAPRGVADFVAKGSLVISQAPGGTPIEGVADVAYDQRAGTVELGSSRVSTPKSRLIVSGTLGRTLQVSARTSDMNDVLPAFTLISDQPPPTLPFKIEEGGSVAVDATVDGPLNDPSISGHLTASNLTAEKEHIDQLRADFDVDKSHLAARNLVVDQAGMQVTGSGQLSLTQWKAEQGSSVAANLNLKNADVKKLLAGAGSTVDFTGTASAVIRVHGTFGAPLASIQLSVDRPAGMGEAFDTLTADLRYTGGGVEVISGDMRLGPAHFNITGAYTHPGTDWTNGNLRFNVTSTGVRLEQFKHAQPGGRALAGEVTFKASGNGEIRKGEFDLTALDSQADVRGLTLESARMGNASITAKTHDHLLDLKVDGNLRNSRVTGSGQWRLTGDYQGRGEIQFTPISFGTLQRVAEAAGESTQLPFQGRLDGRIIVTGPLKNPDQLKADITLNNLEMRPPENQRIRAGVRSEDVVVRNTEPVSLEATTKTITIRSAKFTAKETNIQATGRISFDSKSPWDLQVTGGMNMGILQLFNADLLAQGNAIVDARITGALNDPQVAGKLEIRSTSLYLGDLTTGVDNANGLVTFDRNRATIQRLTAEVGGGRIGFSGFIGFSGGLLIYRVQATADQIRIRYPEDVSTTLNAQLNLTGTSANSLIAGTISVNRAGFTPKADLGSLLAQTAKPIGAPAAPNEYLRNIQLDVRIESGPSLQFQTSMTRDMQAEADLRLRGNVAQPSLVGNVSVNEGEINLFGTKYTINRGEVRFLNPTRIEPIFDIDLETQARGITVNISFSGTLSKLNLTYRSDPPLQTSEIIALIAVGRDPTTNAALAGGQVTQNSMLATGGNVLGQALTAPVTSRLQRFFGISRLKIDPQLTGVENIPQARLTLEQQVSRDITLTYITNLARTQEQIVRIQWDINKEWSAIALRDENGVFGIDFQYRRRFK